MRNIIKKVFSNEELDIDSAKKLMEYFISGEAKTEEIAGFLGAMSAKGETPKEIYALASVMRERALKISLPKKCENAIDLCGTGGDGGRTFNISTAVCFVLAGAGVCVAKHGNRSVSSKSGSIDVLEKLGINVELPPVMILDNLKKKNFGILFAQKFHPAMKSIADVRRKLGVPTIFNVLGPMLNPAGVKRQLMGVYDKNRLEKIIQAHMLLGAKNVMAVRSEDGLDEISLEAPTISYHLKDGKIKKEEITPEKAGLKRYEMSEVPSGGASKNAKIITDILTNKEKGAAREIVVLNAAAGLLVSEKVKSLKEGAILANKTINENRAYKILEELRK